MATATRSLIILLTTAFGLATSALCNEMTSEGILCIYKEFIRNISNSTALVSCPNFDFLKCDIRSHHCPYSEYDEPDCISCRETCDENIIKSNDGMMECLKRCPVYMMNLSPEHSSGAAEDIYKLIFIGWTISFAVGFIVLIGIIAWKKKGSPKFKDFLHRFKIRQPADPLKPDEEQPMNIMKPQQESQGSQLIPGQTAQPVRYAADL